MAVEGGRIDFMFLAPLPLNVATGSLQLDLPQCDIGF